MDRRSEVVNEAFAEELQRDDQMKDRDTRRTTAASAPQELRETLVERDPNPKMRQHVQRSSTDVGSRSPTEASIEVDADRRCLVQRDGHKHQEQNCREDLSGGNSGKQLRSSSHRSRRN